MKNIKARIMPVTALAGLVVGAFAPVVSVSAIDETWGPQDRPMYSWDAPADHVTFNSIDDNPFIGKETNFVRVNEYVEGGEAAHEDNVKVEPGKEYEVWIYYHNNASASLNPSGKGIAQNTRVATSFPTRLSAGDSGVIRGSVSATNASPQVVWDTAFFNADETVWLNYVPNTAVINASDNCRGADGTVLNADALFVDASEVGTSTTAGALIVCDEDTLGWGNIPGCNEFAGFITYRVKAEKPGFWMEKTVAAEGSNNYVEYMDAKAGDTLDFKIYYKNTGTTAQTTVMLRDVLPDKLELVSGSVVATTPEAPTGVTLTPENEAKLFGEGGLNIGNYNAGETATITYKAKIKGADSFSCGDNTFNNDVTLETENGTEYDRTKITVNKSCEVTPPELPETGPGEIAMAIAIVVIVAGGAFYFYKSGKALKKVAAGDSGENTNIGNNEADSSIVREGIQNDKKGE